jgi:hypothetical protein
VWGGQAPFLQDLYKRAGGMFDQMMGGYMGPGGGYQGMQDINQQMNPYWQQQMQGGAYAGTDFSKMYQDALGGGGNEQAMNEMIMGGSGNNYADAMKGQIMQDASNMNMQGQKNLDARAAASQMSGGSRQGIASSQIANDINKNAQNQLTKVGYETFDKDLQRKLDIARNADMFDMQKMQNIGNMWGQQNQAMQGGLNFGNQYAGMQMNPYMGGWQQLGALGQIIGGPTMVGSGNMSGSGSSKGKGMSFG